MRKSISSTALAITVYCLVPLSTAAAVILPSRDISFSRRSNLTTPSALKLTTSDPLNLTTSSGLNLTTSTALNVVNTNPKLGGWCTFHLSYYTSQQLGFSSFQFWLYDSDGAGVASGQPTEQLRYDWGDGFGNNNWNQPPLHFGSRLPYDITVLPHPQENLTWAYNEFSMTIPAPALCTAKDQKPITVGTDPVVLSVGCFQNTGSYKRALAPDDPYEPLQRRYGVRSQIDGGWSC